MNRCLYRLPFGNQLWLCPVYTAAGRRYGWMLDGQLFGRQFSFAWRRRV